jgi:hypothetical protein
MSQSRRMSANGNVPFNGDRIRRGDGDAGGRIPAFRNPRLSFGTI